MDIATIFAHSISNQLSFCLAAGAGSPDCVISPMLRPWRKALSRIYLLQWRCSAGYNEFETSRRWNAETILQHLYHKNTARSVPYTFETLGYVNSLITTVHANITQKLQKYRIDDQNVWHHDTYAQVHSSQQNRVNTVADSEFPTTLSLLCIVAVRRTNIVPGDRLI
jgi:hypothetical protein